VPVGSGKEPERIPGTDDGFCPTVSKGPPIRLAFRQLTDEPFLQARPSWSRDGRWICFGSDKSGNYQVWKVPAEGGKARQITKGGGFESGEAPDGKSLYYTKTWDRTPGVWSVPVDGGEEIPVIESVRSGHWSLTEKGIYFLDFDVTPASAAKPLMLFEFETRKISESNIMLIDNFR